MSDPPTTPQSARALVTYRRVRREVRNTVRTLTVFCAKRSAVVELSDCRGCPDCRGLSIDLAERETFLRCTASAGDQPTLTEASRADAPASHLLSSIMTTPVHCVEPDWTLADLTALFVDRGIGAAPVLDHRGRAIGLVSKTDILRYCRSETPDGVGDGSTADGLASDLGLDNGRLLGLRVCDVMTHLVFRLGPDAAISRAAALMSYEGVHRIVVTDADGRVIGLVSSLDILAWLARTEGYVLPSAATTKG